MTSMRTRFIAAITFPVVAAAIAIGASGDDARFSAPLPWKKPHLSRVFAVGYTDLGTNGRGSSEIKTLNGQIVRRRPDSRDSMWTMPTRSTSTSPSSSR